MPADPEVVYRWLKALGVLTASGPSAEVADNKLQAFVPLLADEFDEGCFCKPSLAYVARRVKFFPAFAEICELLAAWWRERRPFDASLALTGPDDLWAARVRADRANAERDWSDPETIRKAVVAASSAEPEMRLPLGRMLAGAVKLYAPHLLALVPDEFHRPSDSAQVISFPEAS
jgi:hypothetical protein